MGKDSKHSFEEPRAEVVRLEATDVIATSGEEKINKIDLGWVDISV